MRPSGSPAAFNDDALLSEVQASDLLFLSVRTLQTWRSKGCGPAFVRAGRAVRYRRCDLVAWIDLNTVRPNEAPAHLDREL